MSLKPPLSAHDHTVGNAKAAIQVVEYGDYQCPYCGDAYPVTQELVRRYGDKIAFAFRNFPLVEAHPEAFNAAIVAELGASGPGDMGKVMAAAKSRLAGKADMGAVSGAVKAALAR